MEQLDLVLSFCREMIPGKGEDSWCTAFREKEGLLAVFDGCGGAGARTHDCYSGKTEAYMASRLCAGAFYDAFLAGETEGQALAATALERLKKYAPLPEEGGFVMKGSMVRTLPTTAAAALVNETNGGYRVTAIWSGDSRVYLLDDRGLAQLTMDDTSVPDPMDNVYEDGVLRNIFCSDRRVEVHCATVEVRPPFAVLAATDGCYGYVSTPMEFEGMVLQSLQGAQTPEQWENAMARLIGSVAGDDHCLCLAAFGYGSFGALKDAFRERFAHLASTYLEPVSKLPLEDRQSRYGLWNAYRQDYFRFMKGGQSHG